MTIVRLLLAVLGIANRLFDYAEKKALIDEATLKEISNVTRRMHERSTKAQEARAASVAESRSGGLRNDDGYKRD